MSKPKFQLDDVKAHARGKWDMIFPQFAIAMPPKKRHAPCPACGGSDRFRYDDKKEMGDFYCNGCGAGDGFELISRCTHLSFPQVLEEVAAIVGLTADTKITDADRKRWKKEADMRERIRLEEEAKIQKNAARKAQSLWRSTHQSGECAYLERKKVPNLGCLINHEGDLIVPLFDENGEMWNLQYIKYDGEKTFLKGGRVKGCFHFIGTVELQDPVICIAEGYATAASIHLATGYPVAVAFNAGNLLPVGMAIQKNNPHARLIYCADDDSAKENTGLNCANEAVAVTGGIVLLPEFKQGAAA
ncbi:MAG TPA: toprim domain-containing protein [Acinetobacter pseudolwoffii]|nr:toprim domain-containing protein [Acinetobacter pseudolwoffii]